MSEADKVCPACGGKITIVGKKGSGKGVAGCYRFYRKYYKCSKCGSTSKTCKSHEELKKQWITESNKLQEQVSKLKDIVRMLISEEGYTNEEFTSLMPMCDEVLND